MTNEEFINKVVELYIEARNTTTIIKKNIKRGRSHTISSQVEDLFAFYISEIISTEDLPNNIEILIDQPYSYKIDNKSYTFYPDISIIKDNIVIKIFDLKMDLGWNRDFSPFCIDKIHLIEEIRAKEVKTKDGITKESKNYKISNDLKYNIVIISNENISEEMRTRNNTEIANLDASKLCIYTLTCDQHPNTNDKNLLKNIILREGDFKRLTLEIISII